MAASFDETFDWKAGGMTNPIPAPAEEIPFLVGLANLALLDAFIEQAKPKVAARMRLAREDQAASLKESVGSALPSFSTSSPKIRSQIYKRIPEHLCLSILVTAFIEPPFAPYSIAVKDEDRLKAAQAVANQLGVPRMWAEYAQDAVSEVEGGNWFNGAGLLTALAGVGIFAVAVPLVFIAAPAAVAGGAGVLSGLAALGPGGLTGGLLILSSVAAVGGGTATVGAMLSGTAQEVELRSLLLASMAVTKTRLRPATPTKEMKVLHEMLLEAESLLTRHIEISGERAVTTRNVKRKVDSIRRLIKRSESVFSKDAEREMKEKTRGRR